jgi:hypothetical protein
MTEQAIFTLTPFGQLINRGQTEIKSAVPEPSTWAMMLLGCSVTPGFARPDRQSRLLDFARIIQKAAFGRPFLCPAPALKLGRLARRAIDCSAGSIVCPASVTSARTAIVDA